MIGIIVTAVVNGLIILILFYLLSKVIQQCSQKWVENSIVTLVSIAGAAINGIISEPILSFFNIEPIPIVGVPIYRAALPVSAVLTFLILMGLAYYQLKAFVVQTARKEGAEAGRETGTIAGKEAAKEYVDAIFRQAPTEILALVTLGNEKELATAAIERVMAEKTRESEESLRLLRESGKTGPLLIELVRLAEQSRRIVIDSKTRVEEAEKDFIKRNREIATVAYLTDNIEIASKAIADILELLSDDLQMLTIKGLICKLQGNLNEAERHFSRVLKISKARNFQEGTAASYCNLGNIYRIRGDIDNAELFHKKSLEINQNLKRFKDIASDYGNLGNIYATRGDIDNAEKFYNKSLKINQKLKRLEGMASDYGNLGNIYATRGDIDNAEKFYNKSLKINQNLNRRVGIAVSYCNLGSIYEARGKLDKAEEFYNKSLEIDQNLNRPEGIADAYNNLGVIYKTRGDIDKAEVFHKKSLEINLKLKRREEIAASYCNLGSIYMARCDLDKAKEYWLKARELYEKIRMLHMVEKVQRWIDSIENPTP